jgi:hypothetical protein
MGVDADYGEEQAEQDESSVDEMMQGLEEDEMLKDELKMPSDLEDDDEEESEQGLFPDDEEGSFPIDPDMSVNQTKAQIEDEDLQMEDIFKQANDNKEMDIVEHMVSKKHEYINQEMVKKIE